QPAAQLGRGACRERRGAARAAPPASGSALAPRIGNRAPAAPLERRGKGRGSLRARRRARHRARRGADPLPPHALRSRHGHADRGARRPGQVFAAAQAPDHAAPPQGSAGLARRRQALTPEDKDLELALFDLDNTLLSGDSDYEWAQFLVERGVLERAEYEAKNDRFLLQYKAGRLDIHEFLQFQLAPLARYPREKLDEWHGEFMRTRIAPIIRTKGKELVRRHLRDNHLCAIVTSTNAFIAAPIARAFGVDQLLATELEVRDGRFTGKPSGTPCFRQGKVTRLAEWLGGRGRRLASFAASGFYSDSQNDLPLLERVTHPVAVDPDEILRREAGARGWQIISLE